MNIDAPRKKDLPALKALWQQAFGDSDTFADAFFQHGFRQDRCRCLYLEDKPAAALYWFDCTWQDHPVAYLYGVATDQQHQNKGLCRALMEDTHRHLKNSGYAGAALVPSTQDLFRLYEKLGYRAFCPMTTATVLGAPTAAPDLRAVHAEDYAILRRKHLPEGSILQGGDALAFAATFAQFYVGEQLLFCVSKDADTLYFQEYWGDPAAAPAVIHALGAAKGSLRIPGNGPDFAMYLPLDGKVSLPVYFGIAMD